jgi:predicted MFS family arabinose efflux permease
VTAPEGAAGSTRSRLAVGHLLVVTTMIAFLISLAGSALKSTVQVYFLPIAESFDQTRGAVAWATTLFAVGIAVTSPLVGAMADRLGAVRVLISGTALAGVAMIMCGLASRLWLFVLVYGVVVAFAFTMISFVPLGVLVDRLVRQGRKGLIYAIVTNGPAVGFIVLVPLWVWLGLSYPWQHVVIGVGLAFLFVLTPLALLLHAVASVDAAPDREAAEVGLVSRLAVAVRSTELRVLALGFFCCGVSMAFIDVHLVPNLHDHGVAPAATSATFMALGAFEIAGAVVAGRLCDAGFVKRVLVGAYLLRGVAMLVVTAPVTTISAVTFGAVFGASYLATVVATTMWLLRTLPVAARGTGVGVVWMVHSIGVAASSQLGAHSNDLFGSYRLAIVLTAVLVFAAAGLTAALPDRQPSGPSREPGGRDTRDNKVS